jgi:hypothetical protein
MIREFHNFSKLRRTRMDELLNQIFISQWRVIFFVVALLLFCAEFGFRLGLRLHKTGDEARKNQIGSLQGAVLGLLGLLLGFTFAMAVQRYDTRRDLVVQEANSIGTTFLRASFLPEPHHSEIEKLLRRYVDTRLEFYGAGSASIQQQLWGHAVAAGKISPSPLTATFVTSLNETIDLDATRLAAKRNNIPGAVWLLLLLVAGCGCWATGYSAGATGKRTAFSQGIFPVLIAVVITILVDLSVSRRGFIGISQQSLVLLKQSISQQQP